LEVWDPCRFPIQVLSTQSIILFSKVLNRQISNASTADGPQAGVTITYSNGEIACDPGNESRTTVLHLLCDRTNLAPGAGQIVNTYGSLVKQTFFYEFVLLSKYACPQ
jgi:hypothetical protein